MNFDPTLIIIIFIFSIISAFLSYKKESVAKMTIFIIAIIIAVATLIAGLYDYLSTRPRISLVEVQNTTLSTNSFEMGAFNGEYVKTYLLEVKSLKPISTISIITENREVVNWRIYKETENFNQNNVVFYAMANIHTLKNVIGVYYINIATSTKSNINLKYVLQ